MDQLNGAARQDSAATAICFNRYLDVITAQIEHEVEEWLERAQHRIVSTLVRELSQLSKAVTDKTFRPSWLETNPGEPRCYIMYTPNLPPHTSWYWESMKGALTLLLEDRGFDAQLSLHGDCFRIEIIFLAPEISDKLGLAATPATDNLPFFPNYAPSDNSSRTEIRPDQRLLDINPSINEADESIEESLTLTPNVEMGETERTPTTHFPPEDDFSSQNTSVTAITPSSGSREERPHCSSTTGKPPPPIFTTNIMHPKYHDVFLPEPCDAGQKYTLSFRIGTVPPIILTVEPPTATAEEVHDDRDSQTILAGTDISTDAALVARSNVNASGGGCPTMTGRVSGWLALFMTVVAFHVLLYSSYSPLMVSQ